ncbi:MAG: hypothetical protein M1813_009302 [Trichoglossum hirsutum]|nr:MAG: hypothetical protein M1813_009302 [Trichoglossum hirsutum]
MHYTTIFSTLLATAAALVAAGPILETSPNPAIVARQSLPSQPDNCSGSFFCNDSSGAHTVSERAINGFSDTIFYKPGTSFVASGFFPFHGGSQHQTAIFRCPSSYSGPGMTGAEIKAGLNLVLASCKKRCGSVTIDKDSGCTVTLNYCDNCQPSNPTK